MRRFIPWAVLFTAIAGVLGALAWTRLQPPPTVPAAPLPSYGAAPSFQLTDQTNQPFDSSDLKGRVWIADFIFTSCAGTCPGMSAKMTLLQQRLPPEIPLISIGVDPKRDTPPVLAEYALRYAAQPGRWFFLTGPEEEIRRVAQQGFRLGVAEGESPEEPVIHSIRFVLVDREGMIRGYYDSTEPAQLERLVRDASSL